MDNYREIKYDEHFRHAFTFENFILNLERLNEHMSKISFTNEAGEEMCIPDDLELNDSVKIGNIFVISTHVKEYKLYQGGQTLFKIVHVPVVQGYAYIAPR